MSMSVAMAMYMSIVVYFYVVYVYADSKAGSTGAWLGPTRYVTSATAVGVGSSSPTFAHRTKIDNHLLVGL